MGNEHWNTPSKVLDLSRKVGEIGLDPTHNLGSIVGAKVVFDLSKGQDALILPWGGYGLVFLNPPFNNLKKFGDKVLQESKLGTEMIVIAPSDTSTKVFQDVWLKADRICFPKSRIIYHENGIKKGSPRFATIIMYYGFNAHRFDSAFADFGKIIKPGF